MSFNLPLATINETLQTLSGENVDIGVSQVNLLTDIYNTEQQVVTPDYEGINLADGGVVIGNQRYSILVLESKANQIYTTRKTFIPLLQAGESVYVPETLENLQISSTSALDTVAGTRAQQVRILGFDENYNLVIDQLPLNGQTPVVSNFQFRSIVVFFVVSTGSAGLGITSKLNAGDIYISSSGVTTTAGVPDDRTKIWGTMISEEGRGFTGYIDIPPNSKWYFTKVIISSSPASNQDANVFYDYLLKPLTANHGWLTMATANSTTSVPILNMETGAYNSSIIEPNTRHILQLTVRREGGTNDISSGAWVVGILVSPLN